MSAVKNRSNPTGREFWDHVDKVSASLRNAQSLAAENATLREWAKKAGHLFECRLDECANCGDGDEDEECGSIHDQHEFLPCPCTCGRDALLEGK